ncbi:phosphoglycerate mutase [Parahaliea maris]|uniref:Phosphoglycerate mutase n=1 Tax=Parahaliea maris TaxID=2716870 RepID=A0A5C8ZNX4_9GAMM|nr:histidine phosphatase family protein [Parahaliea maris]TXS89289.1 phosphoglycerate mutase [Parahaliea maris]
MKTLHLLRHAKSSWDDPLLADRDRPLNRRGQRDAPRMGQALSTRLDPMAVSCSPARRARLTLEGLCQGWPELANCAHDIQESLYTFDYRDLLDWLSCVPGSSDSLFLVGHNPAFTDLANVLTGTPVLDNLPTAGYLRLELSTDGWTDLPGSGVLSERLFPRELR